MGMPNEPTVTNTNVIPGGAPTSTSVPAIFTNPPVQYFTAEQLEAARQQEKDKLYGRMNAQDEQIKAFQATVAELQSKDAQREAEKASALAAAEEAARKEREAKMSAEELIKAKTEELTAQHQAAVNDLKTQQAILAKEQEHLRLTAFTQRRIAEEVAADTIAPDLLGYITGNTEEEIEAGISKAKEITAKLVAGMTGQQLPPAGTSVTPGVSPTGFGPSGPLDTLAAQRQYTPEQINAMNQQEYAEFRQRIGLDKTGYGKGMWS